WRNQPDEGPDGANCERQGKSASHGGEQETFHCELHQEPKAGGTQCTTNGNLTPAVLGPDQKETGHVDESDQSQQRRADEKCYQEWPNIAENYVGERKDGGATIAIVLRELRRNLLRDQRQIVECRSGRDFRPQARDAIEREARRNAFA